MMNPGSAFQLPVRVRAGRGARSFLPDELDRLDAKRVFLVSDEGVSAAGWVDDVVGRAAAAGREIERRCDVEPNPRARTVDALAAAARSFGADAVVGLGGGSVLDAAKAVALLLTNEGSCTDYEGLDRFDRPPAPFIAAPTTCGTGSEVTRVSVITVVEERRKISVKGNAMFPTAALVDPDLIDTLPGPLVASTGMDALTHAVEAVVGRPANAVSDALAEEAVRRLLRDLPDAVGDDTDDATRSDARSSVMLASTLAGMAFGNADVGAVHCLSESLGGLTDLPHGLLNAVLIHPVLDYQLDAISERLNRLECAVADVFPAGRAGSAPGESGQADRFLDRIARLRSIVGLPKFGDLAIDRALFPRAAALAESNGSNPSNLMDLKEADYLHVLETAAPATSG
jgi:alcohol dehydrogenase